MLERTMALPMLDVILMQERYEPCLSRHLLVTTTMLRPAPPLAVLLDIRWQEWSMVTVSAVRRQVSNIY